MDLLAHISDDLSRTQSLAEHLSETSILASSFAKVFGESEFGGFIGGTHDVGKAQAGWQYNLRYSSGYDLKISPSQCARGTHSSAGAIYAMSKSVCLDSIFAAYIIAGHHAGLLDYSGTIDASFSGRLLNERDEPLLEHLSDVYSSGLPLPPIKTAKTLGNIEDEYKHLWTRMLFSSLVDADYLNTEKFMDPQSSSKRSGYLPLTELEKLFRSFMNTKLKNAKKNKINQIREQIYKCCVNAATQNPGFFSLTVPTGGGKTLSSMAFAIAHANAFNKRRIIMAIPYTSIIEQTSKVYKYGTDDDEEIKRVKSQGYGLFGEENVLEHHSNVDPDRQSYSDFLATQNWDAPIIVTTNVQLFHSLLAARPSRCRKLHNIADSVIILDESQKIPAEYLKPVLSVLKGLVKHFGVTVVLCSATQPALLGRIGTYSSEINGIEECTEIIDDTDALFSSLNRVSYSVYKDEINLKTTWEDVAKELVQQRQVLCIVNKRNDCNKLMQYMPNDTIQLSGLMCGEEICLLISKIKKMLREGRAARVVSTQLIEAGVDISFPVVWRALGQLDSIVQAAGRANREGLLQFGRVVIFNPESEPFGDIKVGAQITSRLASRDDFFNNISSETFSQYFKQYYADHCTLDKGNYDEMLVNNADIGRIQFRSYAENFQLIDTKGQKTVFVPFSGKERSGAELIKKLEDGKPNHSLMAALQRFSVNISNNQFYALSRNGGIKEVRGYYVLADCFYAPGKGVLVDDCFDDQNFIY